MKNTKYRYVDMGSETDMVSTKCNVVVHSWVYSQINTHAKCYSLRPSLDVGPLKFRSVHGVDSLFKYVFLEGGGYLLCS